MAPSKELPRLSAGVWAVDSHCHLDEERLVDDLDGIIERATAAQLSHLITIGGNLHMKANYDAVDLSRRFTGVYATVVCAPACCAGQRAIR